MRTTLKEVRSLIRVILLESERLGDFVHDVSPEMLGQKKIRKLREHPAMVEYLREDPADDPDDLFATMIGLDMRDVPSPPRGRPPFSVGPIVFAQYTKGLYADVDMGALQFVWSDTANDWIQFDEIDDMKQEKEQERKKFD